MKHFIALAVVGFAGCATFSQMESGLDRLVGQPIQAAFDTIGYPSGKQRYGSDTVYYWSSSHQGGMVVPTVQSTSGYVGSTPVYGTTTGSQYVPINAQCEIKIITNSSDMISKWEYNGNHAGCDAYTRRLKPKN